MSPTKLQIYDPHAFNVMSKQREVLSRELESVWRGFFLRYRDERRVAVGRCALAGLKELA